jgi:hypothetical protein
MKVLQIAFCTFGFSVFLSCMYNFSDNFPPIVNVNYRECHNQITWDEARIREALTGQWLLEYRACVSPEGTGPLADQQIGVEFHQDSTLDLFEHGQLIQISTWVVVGDTTNYFSIETSPTVSILYGGMYICDDLMQCYAAGEDICNHYFRRQ